MLTWIQENRSWLFSGIGATFLVAIVGPLRRAVIAKGRKGETTSQHQSSGNASINLQANGTVSIGSISYTPEQKVPPLLAKPSLSIKQTAFSGTVGSDPVYEFLLSNTGGDCFSIRVWSDYFPETVFPTIPRGGSVKIRASIKGGPGALDISVSGLDANGVEHKQLFAGTRETNGFHFH